MKKFNLITAVILAIVFVFSSVKFAMAANTADAREKIDTEAECSLSLTYMHADEEYPLEGLMIDLYQVASVSEDFIYTLIDPFDDFQVEINRIQAQSEWDALTSTIESYVIADGLLPDERKVTTWDGIAYFTGLQPGMYFVKLNRELSEDTVYGFPSFLIAVPNLSVEGEWLYDVEALPKPGARDDTYDSYQVVKYWNDHGNQASRGGSVIVDIYRNGELDDTVELSEENDWTYEWDSVDPDDWTVVERNVPVGYSVTVETEENVFIITNTDTVSPTPPQTGDSDMTVWIVLMAVSGILLIVFGILGRRKQEDED